MHASVGPPAKGPRPTVNDPNRLLDPSGALSQAQPAVAGPRRAADHRRPGDRHRARGRCRWSWSGSTPPSPGCTGWAAPPSPSASPRWWRRSTSTSAPLVVGRHPADIEDITRLVHYSSYWRNGPVLNNALSGVDQALWDIAGKRAGHAGVRAARRPQPGRRRGVLARRRRHHRGDPRRRRRRCSPRATGTSGCSAAARAWAPTARPARAGGYPRLAAPGRLGRRSSYLRGTPRCSPRPGSGSATRST